MKRGLKIVTVSLFVLLALQPLKAGAQIEIVQEAIKKVIRAVDLKVQQMQNKTIWLQNAAKELENKMSLLKLKEISDWTEKQKELYKEYYEELRKIKAAIATYRQVKEITENQKQLVAEYKKAYNLFLRDKHFTIDELNYMKQVYDGMIAASLKCLDELILVVNAMLLQMNDAQRLEVISRVSGNMTRILSDMRQFNNQGIQMSLQRVKEENDLQAVQQLYDLPKN